MGKNGWNAETIILLEKLRRNSIYLSEYHRDRFYHFRVSPSTLTCQC